MNAVCELSHFGKAKFDEPGRQRALNRLEVVDSKSEAPFERIIDLMNLPSRTSSEEVSPQAAWRQPSARPSRPDDCLKGSGGLARSRSSSAQCNTTSAAA